jgi:hypothetical protein
MRYRIAVLSAILLAASGLIMPVSAAGQQSWIFKGTCGKSTIAKSDGIQRGPVSGMMPTRDYLALMQQARANHQTLGPDGFLWSTEALNCDSALVVLKSDSSGYTVVSFSNDDAKTPILGLAGKRIDGDGPLFLSDGVALGDQKELPLIPGSGQGCHFYFTDHGTFTPGWENRLTTIECDLRMKTPDGHLINANVTFNRS